VSLVFPQIWGLLERQRRPWLLLLRLLASSPPPPPRGGRRHHRPCFADGSGRPRAPRRAPPPRLHLGRQELYALQCLRHPHIVHLLAFCNQQGWMSIWMPSMKHLISLETVLLMKYKVLVVLILP
ncbi:unnamed protein product, partial [Urochloa humidicola]